jgi:hypothetical protein
VELRIQLKHLYKVRWHVAQMLPRLQLRREQDRQDLLHEALAELAEDDARLRARVVTIGEDISKKGGPAMRARGRKLLDRLNEANR